jgi:hypothetical protein
MCSPLLLDVLWNLIYPLLPPVPRRRLPASQCLQKVDQVLHLLRGKSDPEALVIEIHHL